MQSQDRVTGLLKQLEDVSPKGYALAMHFKFTAPTYLLQTYDADWTAHYTQNSFVMQDPVVAWGLGASGARSWASFDGEDPAGVLQAAKEFGLRFGLVVSVLEEGSRSVCGFARDDRDYTSAEVAEIEVQVRELHKVTLDSESMSQLEKDVLRKLSVGATHPG